MADDFNIALYYRITRLDTNKSLLMLRDAPSAKIASVGGRWDQVDRPRKTSFTTWNGSDPYRLDVPFFFDGWDTGRSQEDAISILNQMQISPADYSPPPQVKLEGALPVKDGTWVLDPHIDWGTNIIWHKDGYRLRQDGVLHLLQYIEPDVLSVKPPATSHIYTVKAGDTLKSISKSQYGTAKYWSAIKNANNIRDPKKLPSTLRIPQVIGK